MNVLISSASYVFTDHRPGGEFQIAHAFASGLARRGHQVTVLCPLQDLEHSVSNLSVFELGRFDFIGTSSYWRYRLEWWRFAWLSYRKARKLARTTHIDIIHHIRPAVKGRFSLCWLLPIPFVFGPLSPPWPREIAEENTAAATWKDALLNRLADRLNMVLGNRLYQRTLSRATSVPVSSARALPLLPENRRASAPLIPFGVDTDRFCPSSPPQTDGGVLFVGVMEPRKGVDHLLRAFATVRLRHPSATLTLVGGGRNAGEYAALAEALGLADIVTFTGPVSFSDVVQFFQRTTVFCLPSIGEPFGISILQAMACGKPVVSTNSGGVPEFVDHEKSGLLVPPGDPDALAGALDHLLTDTSLREEMGRRNRELCLEQFSWEAAVDRIEQLYRGL